MVDQFDKGIGKLADNTAVKPAAIAPDLGNPTAAGKAAAAKELASSDEQMVKANLLPAMPNFPGPESLAGGKSQKILDANNALTGETTTLAKSLIPNDGSTDLKQNVKYDATGAVTSTDTSWKDAQGKFHDVLSANGKTVNTIVDGNRTDKLITSVDSRSWEHDVSIKSDDGKKVIFKDNLTVGNSGHVNFEDKFIAETKSGKLDFHRMARFDKNQKVEFDHSQWRSKDGMTHETDNFNYGDKDGTNLKSTTNGDYTTSTTTDKKNPPKTIEIRSDGKVKEADGTIRKPDGEVVKETW